jgi:Kef-type K+ transport system membrane component KefB
VSFPVLVVVGIVALAGPLLAWPTRWRVPVVLGELVGGILVGQSGFGLVHSSEPTLTFLAQLGFGLTMFVAGSKVPIRDARLRPVLVVALARVVGVGIAAAILGVLLASIFHTGHAALYAVLMASSSAALILPVVGELGLGGPKVLAMLAQVAIADTACIVAVPLVLDPSNAPEAALGALLIAAAAVLLYFVLRFFDRRGLMRRFHKVSEKRHFALELRVSLIILFSLGALAVTTHVSILLAGFAFGLAVSAVGEPQRLAKQLFALNDGFLGPVFYVWLGASLSLRPLVADPSLILLGLALGVGALLAHVVVRLFRQPITLGAMAAAQLGVPVAAATVGQQTHLLRAGEPSALILGALVTIAGLAAAAGIESRRARLPGSAKPGKHPGKAVDAGSDVSGLDGPESHDETGTASV